jgi:hypothetical protein
MLTLIFINLWATIIALVRDMALERWYTIARRVATALVVLAVAGAVWFAQRSDAPTIEQVKRVVHSPAARIVLAPATVFAHVFAARTQHDFAVWTLASLGMIVAALLLVLAMDKGYMEAAVAASARRQTRLAGMAKGVVVPTNRPVRSLAIPSLVALGPARAIVKKQLITAFRTSRAWMITMVAAVGYGYFMSRMTAHDQTTPALVAMMPALVILLMFLPQSLRFDFRSDLDHIDFLKALPISATAIAAAELAVPSALLSFLGCLIAGGIGIFVDLPAEAVIMGALAVVPISVWVIGLENFMFLLMPTRLFSQGQASMVLSGRRMMMMLAKMGLFVVGGGLVFGAAYLVWSLSQSARAAFVAGWFMLSLVAGCLVLAVSWAFVRFDVSADMPV